MCVNESKLYQKVRIGPMEVTKPGTLPPVKRTILITGCSSGIGRATAAYLARRGHRVYATARKPETLEELERGGCRTLPLDVTDEASMRAAVQEIEAAEGGVEALVNNAGYGLHGAFEETPIEDVRRQFETNVFGAVALTQMVLPQMRARRWGRVVNVSSMGGRITLPGGAFYHGTKHALEAISDVARWELKPFGVDVVLIEPGIIKTRFGDTAVSSFDEADGPYASFNRSLRKTLDSAYTGVLSKAGVGPETVAKAIAKAIESKRPKTRYVTPISTMGVLFARRVLPDRAWDMAVRSAYESPKP